MSQAAALFWSIAIETPVAFVLLRGCRWGGGWRGAVAAAVGTLLTHPLVWHAVPALEPLLGYGVTLLVVEAAVVIVESGPYRLIAGLAWPRALAASLVANAASTAFGLAWFALLG